MTRKRVQVKRDDKWVNCHFKDLTKGDVFRMVDQNGTIHRGKGNRGVWVAESDPIKNENGKWMIQYEQKTKRKEDI